MRSGKSMALEPRATETRLGNIPLKGSDVWKYSQDRTLFLHVETTVWWPDKGLGDRPTGWRPVGQFESLDPITRHMAKPNEEKVFQKLFLWNFDK